MVFTNKDLNKNTYTLGEVANFLSVHPKIMRKVSDKAYKNIGKTRELIQRPILVTL